MRPKEDSAPKHEQVRDASPGLRHPSKPAPRRRIRCVLEATPPALTESSSFRVQPIDPYRAALSRGGGLGPRSLALHLSQHSWLTDLGLAIVSTMSTLFRSCATNTLVKTREPPAPRDTRVGCKSTSVPELLRPLPRFTCSTHQGCAKFSPHPLKQNMTKQNKNKAKMGGAKPWSFCWLETQAGAQAPLPSLPLPTTVPDSRSAMS